MTKSEAHSLLNRARAGRRCTKREINNALIVTGDLDDDLTLIRVLRAVGEWESKSASRPRLAAHPFDGLMA